MDSVDQNQPGIGTLGLAVLAGIAGDALLYQAQWGINFPILTAVCAACVWAALPAGSDGRNGGGIAVALSVVFASLAAWRASPFLAFWNTVAALGLLGIPLLRSAGADIRNARPVQLFSSALMVSLNTARGFLALPPTTGNTTGSQPRRRQINRSVFVGLALTAPITLFFGSLLVSADRGFATLLDSIISVPDLGAHILIIFAIAWLAAAQIGLLTNPPRPLRIDLSGLSLGILELGIPLAAMSLLFLSFTAVQISYIFAGEASMAALGMTYAEYAREGFMQLTVAAMLVIPILVAADALMPRSNPTNLKAFRILSAVLIGCVGALMLSSLHRIALYVTQYGLSEIRLYASVFVLWLATVYIAFATTIGRGHNAGFIFRSVASGLATLVALTVANPEAMIARSQLDRAQSSGTLDTDYLARLSADATPAILDRLDTLDAADACALLSEIQSRRYGFASDWRGWNLARARALTLISQTRLPDWNTETTGAQPRCQL